MTKAGGRSGGYYYGWNIVWVAVLTQMAGFGIAINCLSLYLPYWSRDLHAPMRTLAFCYTAPGTIFCLLAPAVGFAAEKFSVRWMLTGGLVGVAIFLALVSRVTEAWQLLLVFSTLAPFAMVISGFVPCQVLVTRWFERRRGLAIGMTALGQSLAGAFLPPILALALPAFGWRTVFLGLAAIVGLICAPLAALLIRTHPKPGEGQGVEFMGEPAQPGAAVAPPVTMTTKEILARRNFWVLGICMIAMGFISSGYGVNLVPMAVAQGLTPPEAASLLSILALVSLGAKLLSGFLIDRLGARAVLVTLMCVGTGGVVTVQLLHGYAGLALGTVMLAAFGSSIVAVAATVAREFGAAFGRVMGLLTGLGVVGVIAPPLFAFMRETSGGYHAPLILLTVVGGLAILNSLMLQDKKVEKLELAAA